MRRFTRHDIRIGAATIAGALILASCGAGAGASSLDDLSEADKSRLAQEFSDCLAEGGLEGSVGIEGGGVDIDVDVPAGMGEEERLAIEAECEKILEDLDAGSAIDPEDQARLIDAGGEIQSCLAESGYVVAIASDGGIEINGEDQPADFDEDEFAEAEESCLQTILPDLWEKYEGDE